MTSDALAVESDFYLCPSGATPSAYNRLPVIHYDAEQPYAAQLEQIADRRNLMLAIRHALSRARYLPGWFALTGQVSFGREALLQHSRVLRELQALSSPR